MTLGLESRLARIAAIFSSLALSGCYGDERELTLKDEPSKAAGQPLPESERVGSVWFSLTTAGGVRFNSFDYTITGGKFSRVGKIDVSNSTTLTARIGGIPAGSDYSITLQGSAAAPNEGTCSGSASFDILAANVTTVPVNVHCRIDNHEVTPPTAPMPAPIPPLAPLALSVILLGLGVRSRRALRT